MGYFPLPFKDARQKVCLVLKVVTGQAPTSAAPQPGITWQN